MNTRKEIQNIINECETSSNKEIELALSFLSEEFEQTKNSIITLTKHLDNLEIVYNKLLKEHKKRTNVNG